MIRIIVEGQVKTGKSTLAYLIARVLNENGVPTELMDTDGDMRHVADKFENRMASVRCQLREKNEAVKIVTQQLSPTTAASTE